MPLDDLLPRPGKAITIVLLFRPNSLRSQRVNFFAFVDKKVFIKVIDKERPYEASERIYPVMRKEKTGAGQVKLKLLGVPVVSGLPVLFLSHGNGYDFIFRKRNE